MPYLCVADVQDCFCDSVYLQVHCQNIMVISTLAKGYHDCTTVITPTVIGGKEYRE